MNKSLALKKKLYLFFSLISFFLIFLYFLYFLFYGEKSFVSYFKIKNQYSEYQKELSFLKKTNNFYTDRINQKEFGKHSGLGLSISKQIISAHNGDIFAENIINDDKKIIGARVNIILNK